MQAQVIQILLVSTIQWRLGELIYCYMSFYEGLGIRVMVIIYHRELIHSYLSSYEGQGIIISIETKVINL